MDLSGEYIWVPLHYVNRCQALSWGGGGPGFRTPPPPVNQSSLDRAKPPSPAPSYRPRGSRPDLDTPPPLQGHSWLRAWVLAYWGRGVPINRQTGRRKSRRKDRGVGGYVYADHHHVKANPMAVSTPRLYSLHIMESPALTGPGFLSDPTPCCLPLILPQTQEAPSQD